MTETADTDLGRERIASMEEAVSIMRGEKNAARVHLPPGDIDVRAIRKQLGLTRSAFAQQFGLAITAVRDWEQGLRRPDTAARVLLMVIARSPETVAQAVAEAQAASLLNHPAETRDRAWSPSDDSWIPAGAGVPHRRRGSGAA